MDIYKLIEHLRHHHQPVAMCTVVNTKGSVPREAGARMLVYASGEVMGTIGGGRLEQAVIENAQQQIKAGVPKLFTHDLLQQHHMCCGGTVDIFIEPLRKRKSLYIFGAGHVGRAVAGMATHLDFDTFVIDDRKEYLELIVSEAITRVEENHLAFLARTRFDEESFVVIVTYDHAMDRDILKHCIQQPCAYLGMIGSERKVLVTQKIFMQSGISTADQLARVRMPIGKAIGAETPEEIAISILAEIIETKNVICPVR